MHAEYVHQRWHGIPGMFIEDGNNNVIIDVHEGFKKVVSKWPSLDVSVTYRWFGHSSSDPGKYRTREEAESGKQKTTENLRKYLIENNNIASAEELKKLPQGRSLLNLQKKAHSY